MSLRKFIIGLVVLGTLLVLYVGYARIGGTDRSELRVPEALPVPAMEPIDESNDPDSRFGDTSIDTIRQTQFFHLDDAGRPDRAFGFDVFLHKQGDWWQFTHPYLKLFLPSAQCEVTADTGEVQVRTALGQLVPEDALFQGNVVIHIIPATPDDARECFIYLDEVTFVADTSLFSSTGPVRFVSRSAMLEGTGMDLIYDRARNRLELFRILDLDSLRIRSGDIGLYTRDNKSETPSSGVGDASPPAGRAAVAGEQPPAPQRYECVFHRNAVIDMPQRVVVAREAISVKNILWAGPGGNGETEDISAASSAEPNESGPGSVPAADALNTRPSTQLAFDALPMESFDIVVTCDGGCVIAPAGAPALLAEPNAVAASDGVPPETSQSMSARAATDRVAGSQTAERAEPNAAQALSDSPVASSEVSPRDRVVAEHIEYDAASGDAALLKPGEISLWLDPNGVAGGQTGGPPVPMMVAASQAVRFQAASNQVFVEGDCVATVEKTEPNLTQTFTLSAPTFVLDLEKKADVPISENAIALKRFTTSGGQASVVASKKAVGRQADWIRMLAAQLEYEADRRLFTAYGPGRMEIANPQPPADSNAFGFDEPGYAFLRDFDGFTFAYDTNRIAVTSGARPILFDYIPLVSDKAGQHGDAGRLDILLRQTPGGRMGLASLVASGGITYESEDRRFAGSELTYDHEQSRVRVTGDQERPCYFNGALVDQIDMNVKTRSVTTRLQAPSTVQGRP